MANPLDRVHDIVAGHLDDAQRLFNRPMLKATILTDPKNSECSVVVTNARTPDDERELLRVLAHRFGIALTEKGGTDAK